VPTKQSNGNGGRLPEPPRRNRSAALRRDCGTSAAVSTPGFPLPMRERDRWPPHPGTPVQEGAAREFQRWRGARCVASEETPRDEGAARCGRRGIGAGIPREEERDEGAEAGEGGEREGSGGGGCGGEGAKEEDDLEFAGEGFDFELGLSALSSLKFDSKSVSNGS
jgi:hypothetical protein